jgi:hypothetical protein
VTVNENGVECVAEVPVPVMVMGKVPVGVDAEVLIVIVDDPPAVTELGLNEAVAPAGRPLADRDTVCAEPDVTAVLTVAETDPPGVVDLEVGDTEMEKSFPPPPVQVGSPVWTGTLTAFQAALVEAHSAEAAPKRLTAALSEASRTLA